jgi:hypothetical protein
MDELEYLEQAQGMAGLSSRVDRVQQAKQEKLQAVREAKYRPELRKDDKDYGNDSAFTRFAKEQWNSVVGHDYQAAVNIDGKRYNTENKIFNDKTDLTGIWDEHENNPAGDKMLYYLRKKDGFNDDGSQKYLYKTGIADVSAAARYRTQNDFNDWDLIAEKRFDSASTVEKEIHGSQAARDARAFDYGTYSYNANVDKDKAYSDFGAGTSELYTEDILGLDTGTQEQYDMNKAKSIEMARNAVRSYTGREDTFEFVDALESATQKLAGNFVKTGGSILTHYTDPEMTGDGVIESWGKKLIADADKDWGYNDKTLRKASANMKSALREGHYLSYIVNAVKASPQNVANSIPEMAMYAGTGGTGLVGRVAAMALVHANDVLDTREQNNDGKLATAGERMGVFGAEFLATGLDAGIFRFVSMGKKGLGIAAKDEKPKLFKDMLKETPPSFRLELFKVLAAKPITTATEAMVAEGSQEVTTEAIRILAEELGTTKFEGKDGTELLTSEQGLDRLITSGTMGSSGGLGFASGRMTGNAYAGVQEARRNKRNLQLVDDAVTGVDTEQDAEFKTEIAKTEMVKLEAEYEEVVTRLNTVNEVENTQQLAEALERAEFKPEEIEKLVKVANEKGLDVPLKALEKKLQSDLAVLSDKARVTNRSLQGLEQGTFRDEEEVYTQEQLDTEDIKQQELSDAVDEGIRADEAATIDEDLTVNREGATTKRDTISKHLDSAVQRLNKAESRLQAFKDAYEEKKKPTSYVKDLKKFNNTVKKLQADVARKQKALSSAEAELSKIPESGEEVLSSRDAKIKAKEKAEKEAEIKAQQDKWDAEISELEAEKAKLIKENTDVTEDTLDEAKYTANISRIAEIESAIKEVKSKKPEVQEVTFGKEEAKELKELKAQSSTQITEAERVQLSNEIQQLNEEISKSPDYKTALFKKKVKGLQERLDNTILRSAEDVARMNELEDLQIKHDKEQAEVKKSKKAEYDKRSKANLYKSIEDAATDKVEVEPKGKIDKILSKIDGNKKKEADGKSVKARISRLSRKALKLMEGDGARIFAEKLGVGSEEVTKAVEARKEKIAKSDEFFQVGTKVVGKNQSIEEIKGAILADVVEFEKEIKDGKLTDAEIRAKINDVSNKVTQITMMMSRVELKKNNDTINDYAEQVMDRMTKLYKDKEAGEKVKKNRLAAIKKAGDKRLKTQEYEGNVRKFVLDMAKAKVAKYQEDIDEAIEGAKKVYANEPRVRDNIIGRLKKLQVISEEVQQDVKVEENKRMQAASKDATDKILNDKNISEGTKDSIRKMPNSLRTYLFSEVGLSSTMIEDAGIYNVKITDDKVVLERDC